MAIQVQAKPQSGVGRRQLGTVFMVLGALMLSLFLAFKAWSSNSSKAGIAAFDQTRLNSQKIHTLEDSASAGGFTSVNQASANVLPDVYGQVPDTSLWSPKRVHEYNEAIASSSDMPQAVLNIETLDIRVPIYNGADDFNLNRGVARILGTGKIGAGGNLGIAGHRDGFFRPLKDIQLGDRLQLETLAGTQEYEVSSIEIIDPTELRVLAPSDSDIVTLVTCYPFYFVGNAPQRFIVKAQVVNHQVDS